MKRLICSLWLAFGFGAVHAQGVPEIPNISINDIAVTTIMNGQVVILWNPVICNQVGLLVCRFFRAHEYGHVNLKHVITGTFPTVAEFQADCFAAQNAPIQEVKAAYIHFRNNGYMGNWSHGTGFDRAQRIAACAQGRPGW